QVTALDADRLHLDHQPTGPHGRFGHVGVPEDLRPAAGVGDRSFHRIPPQAPYCSASWTRSSRRSSLPVSLYGSDSHTSTWAGTFDERRRSLPPACSSASDTTSPSTATTAATTFSPHSVSGTPTTATSATDGWAMRASSISPGERFSAPRTITSSRRPSR